MSFELGYFLTEEAGESKTRFVTLLAGHLSWPDDTTHLKPLGPKFCGNHEIQGFRFRFEIQLR